MTRRRRGRPTVDRSVRRVFGKLGANGRMPLYEHTFIARPDLTNQQAQALAETLGQLVADQGGQVSKTEYWGLRNLAYRVRKSRKGHYLHLNIEAPAAAMVELERACSTADGPASSSSTFTVR